MAITGKDGGVSIDGGSSTLAELDNWSVSSNADTLETTDFDSNGKREYLAGLTDWSGSFGGRWDPTQAAAVTVGDTVDLQLDLNATYSYSGSAIITGKSVDTNVDGTVDVSYDYQGTGTLTETTS
jgi:predicted secreted protein